MPSLTFAQTDLRSAWSTRPATVAVAVAVLPPLYYLYLCAFQRLYLRLPGSWPRLPYGDVEQITARPVTPQSRVMACASNHS